MLTLLQDGRVRSAVRRPGYEKKVGYRKGETVRVLWNKGNWLNEVISKLFQMRRELTLLCVQTAGQADLLCAGRLAGERENLCIHKVVAEVVIEVLVQCKDSKLRVM
jgi:hypothetical protein